MRPRLVGVLACPRCRDALDLVTRGAGDDAAIESGRLRCRGCGAEFPIRKGIPRFVEDESYAGSFGYQWNRFRLEQLDTANGTQLSATRFWSETDWSPEWLRDRQVVDIGCGAGRFLDVASRVAGAVVGVDVSSAVDAARENLRHQENVDLVQAAIEALPFRPGAFDGAYCIGVAQHTADPEASLRALGPLVSPGGKVAVTVYERKPWTRWNGKYLLRPLTRRLAKRKLLRAIEIAMPIAFPVTSLLFRIPFLGRAAAFGIPVANHIRAAGLTARQRYQWAVLDTFDALASAHDQPMTQPEVARALVAAGFGSLRRIAGRGLTVVADKVG
jgi:SAM-dependent methyltransferase